MAITIKTDNLRKYYRTQLAIDDLNLEVEEKSIFGLVGPNGSGKTTTMNMLSSILSPSSGRIEIAGLDLFKYAMEIKKQIGVVTEDPALFDHLRAKEQIYFSARIYGLSKETAQERMNELFDIFELWKQRSTFIREYSKGMKKKLALMCAIIHHPKVLFLDELFDGLDPIASETIGDVLRLMVKNGCTVFLTSHNLSLIENLCSEVGILHEGKLLFCDETQSIRKRFKDECNKKTYTGLDDLFRHLIYVREKPVVISWLE